MPLTLSGNHRQPKHHLYILFLDTLLHVHGVTCHAGVQP
jgi:hypothetical protein